MQMAMFVHMYHITHPLSVLVIRKSHNYIIISFQGMLLLLLLQLLVVLSVVLLLFLLLSIFATERRKR